MMLARLIAAFSAILAASGAHAAVLTNISGTVMLNRGDGFWEVTASTVVKPGDRVLVRGEGAGLIDYGDGCVTKVPSNGSAVVASKPACDPDATASISGGSLKDMPALAPVESSFGGHLVVLGGFATVGAAAAVTILDDDGDAKPASP